MATVTKSYQQMGIPQTVAGNFTSDNAAQVVTLGFDPAWVRVINETDGLIWEKWSSMAAANSIKNTVGAAGACVIALDTNSQILINGDGTVTLGATLVGNAKAIKWIAGA